MFRVAFSIVCLALVGDKLIAGKQVSIEKYPHQVSVQEFGQHFCGGSLISTVFVLTTAHCLSDIQDGKSDIKDITVRAGSSSWSSGGTTKKVTMVLSHPGYNKQTMNLDVGLIRLDNPLRMSGKITTIPICKSLPADDSSLNVSGWGRLNAMTIPRRLQAVTLKKLNKLLCQVDGIFGLDTIFPSMFCAKGDGKENDSCQGDSGSPVVTANRDCQCGIVSFGIGCAQPSFPVVNCDLTDPEVRTFIRRYVPNAV